MGGRMVPPSPFPCCVPLRYVWALLVVNMLQFLRWAWLAGSPSLQLYVVGTPAKSALLHQATLILCGVSLELRI